jgi:hypothetical protein
MGSQTTPRPQLMTPLTRPTALGNALRIILFVAPLWLTILQNLAVTTRALYTARQYETLTTGVDSIARTVRRLRW